MKDYRILVFIMFITLIVFYNCKIYERFQSQSKNCDLQCFISEFDVTKKNFIMILKDTKSFLMDMFDVSYETNSQASSVSLPSHGNANQVEFTKIPDLTAMSAIEMSNYLVNLTRDYYVRIEKIKNIRETTIVLIDEIVNDLKKKLSNTFEGVCAPLPNTSTEYCPSIVDEERISFQHTKVDINIATFGAKFNTLKTSLEFIYDEYALISELRNEFGRIAATMKNFSEDLANEKSVMIFNSTKDATQTA